MSTPTVNTERAATSAGVDAAADAAGAAGKFQGSATEVVSSKSNETRPDPEANTQISAWKLGKKGRGENALLKSLKVYAEAARSQAQAKKDGSGPQKSASKAKSARKSLLSIFKGSRQPAAAAPAASKEDRLGALAENSRVVLRDPEASVLIGQAGTVLSGTDVIPHARTILQKPDNREELTDFFLQKLDIKGKTQTQKRHFRNISTALTAAECIADTKDAGRRIMQAGHPEMDQAQQAKFAERIELGSLILARLQDVRYVPEQQQLQQLVADSNFNSFGDSKLRNPYLELAKSDGFTAAAEQHIRGALLDALKLAEDCAELVADSALGEESAVDSEQLIEQAGRCGIKISASKETTFADEVETKTSFQVADSTQSPPAGEKLETTV